MKIRSAKRNLRYDLALSFAGEDREFVEEVASYLVAWGLRVFYDKWETSNLIGRNLYEHLDHLYQNEARFCVMFISKHYVKISKRWPHLERQAAEARAFDSRSVYILPVRLDGAHCPGVPKTIGYIPAKRSQPSEVALALLQKCGRDIKKTDLTEYQFKRAMQWKILWDGSVQARCECHFLFLGSGKRRQLGFNVWSPDGSPLKLRDVWAKQGANDLRVTRVGRADTSAQFRIVLDKPVVYGQAVSYAFGYTCENYYENIERPTVDDFTVSLPTRLWEYKFLFPKNSALKTFQITRQTGKSRVREYFTSSSRNGCPCVDFHYRSPKVGSRLALRFCVRHR